jgi:hypothetical protein
MGTNITAAAPAFYMGGLGCGACYQVKCVNSRFCLPGTTINVTVTDFCPTCLEPWHFELSQPAFAIIAYPDALQISVMFARIPCTYSTNIALLLSGDAFAMSVLVRNEGGAGDISVMEVKKATDAAWTTMTHTSGANWSWSNNGDLNSAFSFQITTLFDQVTVVLTSCIPSNPTFGQLYYCNNQIKV